MEGEILRPAELDFETFLDILDDSEIEYRIAVVKVESVLSYGFIRRETDHQTAATYANYWQQIYFDWFNIELS